MATKAPSTAPANPLEESFARVTGLDPMSKETGTAPISYGDADFRSAGGNAPASDVITIQGDPGTGATTAETWSHDIALENQRREQLEFEYQQQQEAIANQLRQQEAARAVESLGLSKAASAREAASEARLAALAPYQLESTKAATRMAQLDAAAKARQAQDEQRARDIHAGIAEQFRWQGNYPITSDSTAAYMAARAPQNTWGTFEYNTRGATPVYQQGVSTYRPQPGTWDYLQMMRNPNRG